MASMNAVRDLAGKVAIVTGGGSGLGRDVSFKLASLGVIVTVADLDNGSGSTVAAEIQRRGGRATSRPCDVTDSSQLREVFEWAFQEYGHIDIVLNNAGIAYEDWWKSIDDHNKSSWKKMIDINLTAVIEGTGLAVFYMKKNKGQGGVIINTASLAAIYPQKWVPVYAATKSAVMMFSRSLAALTKDNIRVCAICPGFTDTPMVPLKMREKAIKLEGGLMAPDDITQAFLTLILDTNLAGGGQVIKVTAKEGQVLVHKGKIRKSKL
eukprot:TRINITY_DN8083_c0_g1_i1.p1 TRINITY_DN8083_c0_g1~~TRINITY_DN8083_c0_g1_i1.p1  ORF type:complete len:266 (-),score=63.15 TRINITY_DN8083_c0_g1_i1:78-875(-)